MMMNSNQILLGYDFDKWYGYGKKEPIYADISPLANSQTLFCGMSGSGKSFATYQFMARLTSSAPDIKMYFSDFKQDDTFSSLRDCSRYYGFENTLIALDIVYSIMHKRQSGEDQSRNPITLIWDEYVANILYLQNKNKKKAEETMRKVSEILMLGRSLNVRLVNCCQRPDAVAFPTGSRLNYGIIIILGAPIKSIYEMLIPKEYIDLIGDRKFGIGEGVVLLQSSELHVIKIPMVRNIEKMQQICITALSDCSDCEGGGEAESPCNQKQSPVL